MNQILLAAVALVAVGILGYAVRRSTISPTAPLGRLKHALGRHFMGDELQYGTRLLVGLVVLVGTIAGLGLWYALTANVSTEASSAPVVTTMLEWATNVWLYIPVALFFSRGSLWGFRKSLIRIAARETGYTARTIERLATEARTTDGTTRILVFSSDDVRDAAQRIRWGFQGKHELLEIDSGDHRESPEVEDIDWLGDLGWRDDLADAWPGEDEERPLTPTERWTLFKMDLHAGLNWDDLVWRFAAPAVVVFAAELIAVQFWVELVLYPVFAVVALFAGILSYTGFSLWRQLKLNSLRGEVRFDHADAINVPVKTVETDELTVYMGFIAGRTYVHTDPEQLAETLAERAIQRTEGKHPAPAIEERYAWAVKNYILSFNDVRDAEKERIYDDLIDRVYDDADGILPKPQLAYDVVEHDRRYIWQGLRFVGKGYDPRLVAECYAEIVPYALVEETVTVTDAGEERSVTAVRGRTQYLPKDMTQIRATFSQQFRSENVNTRYDLPEVSPEADTGKFVSPELSEGYAGSSAD
jgi:hypothetical protein